jgi:glycosyltransferase involved in cell wall biosynthesis
MKSARRFAKRLTENMLSELRSNYGSAAISIFHQFSPPPGGGGHQFLRGLMQEFRHLDYRVENNSISRSTRACLFNSFNFDTPRLQRLRPIRPNCKFVHRVDGPISVYRGTSSDVDYLINVVNRELADATIFQSQYSLDKHLELGFEFINPQIILNAADPAIFYPNEEHTFSGERRMRIISVSWSDNPNKGEAVFRWLDENLDWNRYRYTFVGRTRATFNHIEHVKPVNSVALAKLLRAHDIYLIASLYDPCSNSLIEALSCGLPAIYARSGGHPEIAGQGGCGFDHPDEIPALLEKVGSQYNQYRSAIHLPAMPDIARKYLGMMELLPIQPERP